MNSGKNKNKILKKGPNPGPSNVNITGFPISQRVKLTYCDAFNLSTSTTVVGYNDFRANGPFDPDVSVGGHQPLGYDQWSAFYNHYIVEGCDIEVDFWEAGNASTEIIQCGILLCDDTTVPDTPQWLYEQPKKLHVCGLIGASSGSRKFLTLKKHFDAKTFFNVKNVKDVREIGALISSSPEEQAYWHVYFAKASGDTSSFSFPVRVKLVYDVVFSEPKSLAQS
jgi:hypothetical protein